MRAAIAARARLQVSSARKQWSTEFGRRLPLKSAAFRFFNALASDIRLHNRRLLSANEKRKEALLSRRSGCTRIVAYQILNILIRVQLSNSFRCVNVSWMIEGSL